MARPGSCCWRGGDSHTLTVGRVLLGFDSVTTSCSNLTTAANAACCGAFGGGRAEEREKSKQVISVVRLASHQAIVRSDAIGKYSAGRDAKRLDSRNASLGAKGKDENGMDEYAVPSWQFLGFWLTRADLLFEGKMGFLHNSRMRFAGIAWLGPALPVSHDELPC